MKLAGDQSISYDQPESDINCTRVSLLGWGNNLKMEGGREHRIAVYGFRNFGEEGRYVHFLVLCLTKHEKNRRANGRGHEVSTACGELGDLDGRQQDSDSG